MRDGPPSPTTVEAKTPKAQQPQSQSSSSLHDTAVGPVPATSTTTLLKEISTLRSRLRDLEDDTKSSVSMDDRESQLSVLLRRELAQVQQEQAQQQLQFMNQLAAQAVEHDRVVQTLQQELTESKQQQQQQNENDETRNPDQERVWILLETERQTHAQQLQRLTANMESADLEIAHCRRDMDELSQALEECLEKKEDLLEEVTRLRLDVQTKHAQVQQLVTARDEARKQVQTKENEVGSMNDLIVSLEDQKAMLVEEVTELKGQLYKQQQQQQSTPRHYTVDTAERPITPTEKKHLEAAVEQLETRLVNFTAKLKEKDETIQQLAATLQEERLQRSNSNETVVTVVDTLSVSAKRARDVKDHASEVSFLRNQNKLLNDELKAWKRKELDQRQLSPVRTRTEHVDPPPPPPPPVVPGGSTTTTVTTTAAATSQSPLSTPQRKRPAALVLSPRGAGENQSRGAGENNKKNLVSPRTPVSGLVASFERRMVTKKPENDCNTENLTASLELMQQDLDRERLACQDLQKKLRQEKAVVSDLRAQLDRSDDSQELQHELQTSLAEIQRLQSLVDDYQSAYAQLESQMLEEQEKAERLLSEQQESEREIKSLSDQLVRNLQELDRLKAALQSSNSSNSGGEEKKEEEVEEISRLKEQVGALQSELETAWQRGEELEAKLKESHTKMAHDAEINRLTIELTNTQMLKDELEKEYEKNLTDLEKEFEELEAAADQELDAKQRVIDDLQRSLREKEEEVARLDSEKSHLCDSMNNLSFSRRDEVDDMQAELLDATAKTTAQQREIAILKGKIEDYQAELSDLERNSKKRIAQLEEDLHADNGSEEYEQVKAENVRLRESIKTVRHERRVLKERLDSLVADKSNSKSAQILRDRNSALKEEVEKLTKRLKKMEASITRFAI